ncbi:MAG TPA: EamA family transporter RarD [Candidatus Nanopelagicales bacterium]|nr:EamA family transporter RarD [Candidatus Nanopelagicales bacterium]
MSGTPAAPRSAYRVGLLLGIGAYGLWGLFPLFWPLLEPASALEILADRFVWSFVFLALILTATRSWSRLRPALSQRRNLALLVVATVLISANWGVYIWAVNSGRVVEASLGYFINPLMVVLLGTLVFKEHLRRLQWTAVGIAAVAVTVLTLGFGGVPWIAFVLAVSWAGYGVVKKTVGMDPIASLTIETAYATPFAVLFLVWLQLQGTLAFGHSSPGNTVLLMLTGVVTAVPLVMFGGAANRIPLSTIGVLQYLTPTIQFVIGITVAGEQMSTFQWIGFVIVWAALIVFTYDGVRHARRTRAGLPDEPGVDEVEAPV